MEIDEHRFDAKQYSAMYQSAEDVELDSLLDGLSGIMRSDGNDIPVGCYIEHNESETCTYRVTVLALPSRARDAWQKRKSDL